MAKRGRPKSIARVVAEETGVNVRTVYRALAGKVDRTPEEATVERLLTVMRNCATFCRENSWADVANLTMAPDRADRLSRDVQTIEHWLADCRSPYMTGESE